MDFIQHTVLTGLAWACFYNERGFSVLVASAFLLNKWQYTVGVVFTLYVLRDACLVCCWFNEPRHVEVELEYDDEQNDDDAMSTSSTVPFADTPPPRHDAHPPLLWEFFAGLCVLLYIVGYNLEKLVVCRDGCVQYAKNGTDTWPQRWELFEECHDQCFKALTGF